MAKQPISIRVTSKEVLNFFVEQKSEGKEISYRSAAIKLMPKGVKWFESGADWDFAFWLASSAAIMSPLHIPSKLAKQSFNEMNSEKKQRGGARPNTGPKRGASLPASGDLVKMPPIWVDAETLEFLRTLPNLSEFVRLAIKDKRSTGTMKDKLKEFVCPIDDRVKIQVPEWADYTPHCTTTMPNAACKYIGFGCVGCRVDKEAILLFQKTVSEQLRDLKKK